MTEPERTESLRLLPWTNDRGQPCYLSSHGTGYITEIADETEAAQLDSAAELLTEAKGMLAAKAWTTQGELHLMAVYLTDALTDVHRIAMSRGARLPVSVGDDEDDSGGTDSDGPTQVDQ